jgi:hypothetical protein
MACLKVLLGCALFLAGSLGESWYAILEALQNADGVLTMMAKTGTHAGATKKGLFGAGPPGSGMQPSRSVSGSQPGSSSGVSTVKHPLLSDLDVDTMQLAVQKLFDSSKNLEDLAFRDFINALCKLSSEMVGMQTSEVIPVNGTESGEDASGLLGVSNRSQDNIIHRRRVSGIYIPKNLVSRCFSLDFIISLFMLRIREPEISVSRSWVG